MKKQTDNPYTIHTSIYNESPELLKMECKNCGASLKLVDKTHAVCPYCGQTFLIDEAKGTVIDVHVDYGDSPKMRQSINSTKQVLIVFLIVAVFLTLIIFGFNIAARNSSFSSSDADMPVDENGMVLQIFCKDVFGKEYRDVTEEEFASIKYLKYAYTRVGSEDYSTLFYSFTDYRDCADEEEFQDTVKTWTYRAERVSWPSDYTMLTGLTRIDTTDSVWLSALRFAEDADISYVDTDDSLKTVSAVLNPEKIRVLHLGSMGTSLDGIGAYTSLEELEVDTNMGTEAVDLSEIGACRELKRLSLRCVGGYTGVEQLKKLSQLTSLSISGMSLQDCSFFTELQNLEEISIYSGEDPDLSVFSALPNLKRLYLLDEEYVAPREIRKLQGLEALQIAIDDKEGLNCLAELESLKYLDLHMAIQEYSDYKQQPLDVSVLAGLNHLQWLSMDNFWEGEFQGIGQILNMPELTTLKVGGDSVVSNVQLLLDPAALADNPAIEELRLSGCSILNEETGEELDFSFLTHYKGVKKLYLDNCDLTDISVLSELSDLRVCSLQNNEITDFSPLLSCKKLEKIYIYDNPCDDPQLPEEILVEEEWR